MARSSAAWMLGVVMAASARLAAEETHPLPWRPPALPLEIPGELIVQFRGGAGDADVARMIRAAGGERARPSAFGGRRYLVGVAAGLDVAGAVERLRVLPEVAFAEPNGVLRAAQAGRGRFTPDDTSFSRQWHFKVLDAERTWGIQTGDPSVVVAVLDTGIAYEDFGPFRKAPDFGTTVFVPGFDFVNGDDHANDDNFHGTHVASTIAESTNNRMGVAGLAFGCALMPVKVLDESGMGSAFAIAEGIHFAARDPRVKVINLSLGGGFSEAVRQAVDDAATRGVTVVAAAGNDGGGTVLFPASLPNVMAVGAVDGRKARAPYSNRGSALDVMAPGGDLDRDDTGPDLLPDGQPDGVLQQTFNPLTARRTRRFDDFGLFWVAGTSQATAHVSALAALLVRQGITDPEAVRAAIETTAEDLGPPGRDDEHGHGLIRPPAALSGLGLTR
jgi:serine protease